MLSFNLACSKSLEGPSSVACDDANVHALEKLGKLGPAGCALRGFLLDGTSTICVSIRDTVTQNLLPTTLFDLV